MGIRQTINEKPGMSIGITIGVIALALIVIIYEMSGGRAGGSPGVAKAYFSHDDGASWFADDNTKIPPFTDSDGKTAVKAWIYKCGDSGKPFCAYLERYTDEGKKKIQTSGGVPSRALRGGMQGMSEVKKPGKGNWIKSTPQNMDAFQAVRTPVCPEGSTNGLQMVTPE